MIERESKYIEYGNKRIDEACENMSDVELATFDIKPIKVSFKSLVDKGYLTLGETFVHKNGNKAILYSPDGKLEYNGHISSMHIIAGEMMKSNQRKNGFDYFYVMRDHKLISINTLRNQYRSTLSANIS